MPRLLLSLLTILILITSALADPPEKKEDKDKPPPPVVTDHEVTIGGQPIKYKATAGCQSLMDDKGKIKANIFFMAYDRQDAGEPGTRPVTFVFNGGPGSSSVWLHLGALGPRRVEMGPEGETPVTPTALTDNASSWLDFTDLVFIDPVSTGFSRAAEGEDPHQFHGIAEDARALGDFIRLFCTRTNRWASPKYLCGESYGTTRASALAAELGDSQGILLDGIVLVSPVLNFVTLSFDLGNDVAYWLFLPSYTATAFHHKKLAAPWDADFNKAIDEAVKFASGEYLLALAKGDALTPAERDAVATKMSALTGLSKEYCLRADLRVSMGRFAKELLRADDRTVGRYDSRYKGVDRLQIGEGPDFDPSYTAVLGPFTASFNQYIRHELKYESDQKYEILTGNVHPWNMNATNRYASVAESLRAAMCKNPRLRVLATCGYYDLATPFHAMTYTITHLGLDESVRKNITQEFYGAGHMMYLRHADLVKLKADAAKFYGGK